jgi:hypothetical protein
MNFEGNSCGLWRLLPAGAASDTNQPTQGGKFDEHEEIVRNMTQIYKATLPYLWWTVVANIVTVAWPGLSLWLPKLMLRH